jgi:hypothetical protein
MAKNNSQVKKSRAQKREWIERFLSPYRITAGTNFRLQSIDPATSAD